MSKPVSKTKKERPPSRRGAPSAGSRTGAPHGWRIDRASGVGLVEQIVRLAKAAIMRGEYLPGEPLPGILETAHAAGCGAKTVRAAYRRLADEGWTEPRRHVGSVVLERGADIVRGRVLFFNLSPFYCYYSDQLVAEMRTRLLRGGYGITTCAADICASPMRFYRCRRTTWSCSSTAPARTAAHSGS